MGGASGETDLTKGSVFLCGVMMARKRRIGRHGVVLVLALALVLGTTGVAFAKWCDEVVVEAGLATGKVDLGLYHYASWDPGPNYLEPAGVLYPVDSPNDGTPDMRVTGPAPPLPLSGFAGAAFVLGQALADVEPAVVDDHPNIASTHSTNLVPLLFEVDGPIVDFDPMPFYPHVREQFNNVYAWYLTGTTLVIGNNGTLPVHLGPLRPSNIVDPSGALPYAMVDYWEAYHWSGGVVGDSWGHDFTAIDEPSLMEFLAAWPYGTTLQLEPGDAVELDIAIYFIDAIDAIDGAAMPQGGDISLEVAPSAAVWNKG